MRWTDIEDYKGRPGVNVIQKKTKKEVGCRLRSR
jgi:hypothetical protein